MSHFTCLVIGPNIEAQLQPFHEYECTGTDVDRTEEARAEYERQTKTMARNDATGELVDAYDDRFYRDPTAEEIAKHGPFHGSGFGGGCPSYSSKDWGDGEFVRLIKRTNENAQWDWWVIGGRWTGFFPLKERATGVLGRPGLMTPRAEAGTADQCRKGDIDFERARAEAEKEAAEDFAKWERCFADAPTPEPWSAFFDRIGEGYSTEQARQDYSRQVALTRWERVKDHDYRCPVSTFGLDRQAYIDRCRNGALVPFAIVKDGKWHERGSMGWWGCVSNEMDTDAWNEQVQRLYDDLPDDTMLTIVDCHI